MHVLDKVIDALRARERDGAIDRSTVICRRDTWVQGDRVVCRSAAVGAKQLEVTANLCLLELYLYREIYRPPP
jgi:hypothetical protein